MSWWMEIHDRDPAPKRGDLIQTNVGDRRERTWIIIRSAPMRRRDATLPRRFKIWKARWWEIEPETRLKLYESATRNGGQGLWECRPLAKPKKKRPEIVNGYYL